MSPFDFLFKSKSKSKSTSKRESFWLGKRQGEKGELEDGARLLQDLISACDGRGYYPIRMFSAQEIEEAIEVPYIGDGYFRILRGTYQDRPIFIKINKTKAQEVFNEIVTVAQINHRNVVKLLGCCFELEGPILIYELLPNNLSRRLHEVNPAGPISWENRLRIAIEISYAVTYIHTATSRPIIHRDIKSTNILLDEHCRPKLCDFSLSITIPLGQTHVEIDRICGTYAYMAPEYLMTGTVSEKTDVYSFGILLLEILSGKKTSELIMQRDENGVTQWDPLSKIRKEEIISLILENGLSTEARQVEQSVACSEVIGRCTAFNPDHRPSMKDVTQQLMQIERAELTTPSSSSSLLQEQRLGKYKID